MARQAEGDHPVRYFVTGAAGFIGSHFVRELMSGAYGVEPTGVTVYDKLTYAGNLENLASVAEDPRFTFVQGDICDGALLDEVLPGHDAVVHFAAESHVDRSIHGAPDFVVTNVLGTQTLLDACLRHGIPRFVHVCTDEVYGSIDEGSWDENEPLEPNSPYSRLQGRLRPARARLLRHLRAGRLEHPLLQQLRAVPVPGEGHPAVRHQPDRRRQGAALRRRPQRARLAARRRPLPRHRARPREGRAGGVLQHRRRHSS